MHEFLATYCASVCLSVRPLHNLMHEFRISSLNGRSMGRPVPSRRLAASHPVLSGHGRPLSASSFWLSMHKSIVSDSMQA